MDSSDYIYILNKPNAISEQHSLFLDKIIEEFPYLQSARALRLKKLYNQNSYTYNQELKKTACFTTDRGVLFELITSKDFVSIQKDFFDTKKRQLEHIDVIESKDAVVTDTLPVIDHAPEVTDFVVTTDEVVKTPFSPEEHNTATESVVEETVDSRPDANNNERTVTPETITVEEVTENTDDISEKEVPAITFLNDLIKKEESEAIFIEKTAIIQEQVSETTTEAENVNEKESVPEQTPSIVDASQDTNTYDIIFVPKNDTVHNGIIKQEAVDPIEIFIDNTTTDENKITEPTTAIAAIEEKLQIGKPLDFSKEEKHSFQEWLQLSSFTLIDRSQEQQNQDNEKEAELEKQKKLAIIDKFIETNPKIPPVKNNITVLKVNEEHTQDHSMLMTETLAKVYLEQKKYQKAIQAYQILILKYPEKSSFFADRISDIKILQKNNF